ncbi:acetate--CoA ligase family protein [Pacificimonas sp. ICDLI1SI03]
MARREAQTAIRALMNPDSVAVIGVSRRKGTAGRIALESLLLNRPQCAYHAIGSGAAAFSGCTAHDAIEDLPAGIDLVILAIPAEATKDAVSRCAARGVRAAVIFASGFAESGNASEQEEIAAIAANAGMLLLGPNSLGFTNHVAGFAVTFAIARKIAQLDPASLQPGVAIVAQSGGMMAYTRSNLAAANLPVSYAVATGNEAGLTLADFVAFLALDEQTNVIAVYAEEIRDPDAFLEATALARANGKPVVLIHPGRSTSAKAAVQSHTGALAADYSIMMLALERAGVICAATMEEFVDIVEIVARYPDAITGGLGIVTFSGGFVALAHDFCEGKIDFPALAADTTEHLKDVLPPYIPPGNPLDLGTQAIWQPEIAGIGTSALLEDPAIGCVLIAIATAPPPEQQRWGPHVAKAIAASRKPSILALPPVPLAPELEALRASGELIISRSPERSMRALAALTRHARRVSSSASAPGAMALPPDLDPAAAAGSEARSKALMARLGMTVPAGALVDTAEAAVAQAERIGWPVVLKAHVDGLLHKSDAGGVRVGIADAAAMRMAWDRMSQDLARHNPSFALDQALVEGMAPAGVEMVIGARRDPRWGPVLLAGMGGIFVEVLRDTILLAADLDPESIRAELARLRGYPLLAGVRGRPPADVDAVAQALAALGKLMIAYPEIAEVEVNPLIVHEQGATVADVLLHPA